MIMALHGEFNLNGNQRAELQAHLRRHNLPASVAQRMRIVLMLADGASYSEMRETLETAATTISRWKKRYEQDGLEGPATFHPGQRDVQMFGNFQAFLKDVTLPEIDPLKVEAYQQHRVTQVSPATVNLETALLKHMLNMAERRGMSRGPNPVRLGKFLPENNWKFRP